MPMRWLMEDLARSLRRIRRRGWNTVHLVLALAVGFGCVTGMFDIGYGALHVSLDSAHPDKVAVTGNAYTRRQLFAYDQPNPHLGTVFEVAAEYKLIDANLDLPNRTGRVRVAMVSPGFFSALGVSMSTGRDFSGADFAPDPRTQRDWLPIIISSELWRSYFGSSQAAMDRPVELTIPPYRYQVAGVAPPAAFPAGVDAWIPVHLVSYSTIQTAGIPEGSGGVICLLKPELTIPAAEAAIRTWPKDPLFENSEKGVVKLVSLREFSAGEIYPLSLRLWLASICFLILLIIAAASIFQSEAEGRRDEFAIKSALGASLGRLLGALAGETALVVWFALAAGLGVRAIVIHAAAASLTLPQGFQPGLHAVDLAMAMGAGGAAFIAALAIQGFQLLNLSSAPISERLGAHSVRGYRKGRGLFRYRVPVQLIPAAVMVIVAGLFVRGAYNTIHIDTGVETGGVFIGEVSLSAAQDRFAFGKITPDMPMPERARVFHQGSQQFRTLMNAQIQEILNTLSKSPGIMRAGAISTAPYRGRRPGSWNILSSAGPHVSAESHVIPNVIFRSVTPGAISALGMRILYGQDFSGRKAEDNDTIIVNEALAERLGGPASAIGRYLQLPSLPPGRIAGVVSNVHEEGVYSQVWPTAYCPLSQYAVPDVDIVVQASNGMSGRDILQLVRASVRAASSKAAVSRLEQLDEMVQSAGTLARYSAYYLVALGLLSLLLAGFCTSSKTIGEFHRRREEIGIRLALGATRARIVGLFLYSDLWRNACALLAGALLAWWFSRLLRGWLYQVDLFDPLIYSISLGILIGSTAMVQVLLLTRALRKDPRDLM